MAVPRLFHLPKQTPLKLGVSVPGAEATFLKANTTTKQDVYTTAALDVAHSNPVVADSSGEFATIYLDDDLSYRVQIRDASQALIYDQDDINDPNVRAPHYKQTTEESGAGVTISDFTKESRELRRYEVVDDGSTDNTATIKSVGNALSGVLTIPYNVLYNRSELLTGLDSDVVFLDFSQINNFNDTNETAKRVGIISSDEAISDTQWSVDSAHHPVLVLNNHGNSGSTSANERLGTLFWAVGQFENNTLAKRGDRGGAQLQFGQVKTQNFWHLKLSAFAPWASITKKYENWVTGEVVAIGDARRNAGNHYTAATAGTTGATAPTHTTGTVSDGAVDWTWIDSADRTIMEIDEYGRVLYGSGTISQGQFQYVPGISDPDGGSVAIKFKAINNSKLVDLMLLPTTGAGAESSLPYITTSDASGWRLVADSLARVLYAATNTEITFENARFAGYTTAQIEDATHGINTADKFYGKVILNTTTNYHVMASGSGSTATWLNVATGAVLHTPIP